MSSSIAEALAAALAAASRKPRVESHRDRARRFYASFAWRRLRYETLERYGGKCMVCGASAADGAKLHCDHITPLSVDWSRRLDASNVQVMCDRCNLGKSNRSTRDWRDAGEVAGAAPAG